MPPKGLLFDFDGTLYGDWRLWIATIQDTLQAFQINITPYDALDKAREMIKDGSFVNISGVAIALAKQHGVSRDEEVRVGFLGKMDEVMDSTGPGNDLLRLLNRFKRDNFRMGLVTFMRQPRLMRRLDKWRLAGYFQSITTPEQLAEFKPSPKPFVKTIRELGVEPFQCFVVGDEPVDMMGARAAEARAIGLPQGFFSGEELEKAGADIIINSLSQLPGIVRHRPDR